MSWEEWGEPVGSKPLMPLTLKQRWTIWVDKIKFMLGRKDNEYITPKED